MPSWIDYARAEGVTLRIGVTTTGLVTRGVCGGAAQGGEAGRLVPVDGSRTRIVSSTSGTAAGTVQSNLDVGTCHNLMQGLETMRQALSSPLITSSDDPRTPQPNDGNRGLLRASARLAIVVVADEDDHSGFDPETYAQFVQALKGPGMAHRAALHAVVPTDTSCSTAGPPGPRLQYVARQTGGTVTNICRSDYNALLTRLISRASGPQADFQLSATPLDPAAIRVRVAGRTIDPALWQYDPSTNSVVFRPEAIPTPGQRVEVRYRAVCAGGVPPSP
jgi:hypothetical protein